MLVDPQKKVDRTLLMRVRTRRVSADKHSRIYVQGLFAILYYTSEFTRHSGNKYMIRFIEMYV